MRHKLANKNIYISPLEAKHYILDIPVLQQKYIGNAVRFALKGIYPGKEENTLIDYIVKNNTVIGIAANLLNISQLKEKKINIISPALVINQLFDNGVFAYCGRNWFEIQIIKNSKIEFLQSYSERSLNTGIKKYKNFLSTAEELGNVKVIFFTEDDCEIKTKLLEQGFELINISTYEKKINFNKAKLFTEKTNKKKIFMVLFSIFLLFALLIADFLLYKNYKNKTNELKTLKELYNKEKHNVLNVEEDLKQEETPFNSNYAVSVILNQIYKASANIRIVSFSITGNVMKCELENAKAFEVTNFLSFSGIFSEVLLHQVLPQDNGTERFIISGKIKND